MQLHDKHYWQAVVWHYVAHHPGRAIPALYLALEQNPQHAGAQALLRLAGHEPLDPNTLATIAPWTQKLVVWEAENTTALLEADAPSEAAELFLLDLFAYEEFSEPLIEQLAWQSWIARFGSWAKADNRVWLLIFQHNWPAALSLVHQADGSPDVNPKIVVFQKGYLCAMIQRWPEAADYLVQLLGEGGVYERCAVKMLLRLPYRQFTTLSSWKNLGHNGSCLEKIGLAYQLKKWDMPGVANIMTQAIAQAKSAQDHWLLASLALEDDAYKTAARCLRQTYRQAPELWPDMVSLTTAALLHKPDRHLSAWCQWLFQRAPAEAQQLEPAKRLAQAAPPVALALYKRLARRPAYTKPGILGQAEALFYRTFGGKPPLAPGKSSWADRHVGHTAFRLLEQAGQDSAGNPGPLWPDSMACYGRWQYYLGEYGAAWATLSEAWAKYPGQSALQQTIAALAEVSCPCCASPLNDAGCPHCGYRPLELFTWQDGKLRFNAPQRLFPTHLVLVTTDAVLYSDQTTVRLILFATQASEADLVLLCEGNAVRQEQLGLAAGLNFFREEHLPVGAYKVCVRSRMGLANTHFFTMVKTSDSGLKVTCRLDQAVGGAKLIITLTDHLGFPITGHCRVSLLAAARPTIVCPDIYSQDGVAQLVLPDAAGDAATLTGLVFIESRQDGAQGMTMLPDVPPLSNQELGDALTRLHQEWQKSLPMSLSAYCGPQATWRYRNDHFRPVETVALWQAVSARRIIEQRQDLRPESGQNHPVPVPPGVSFFYQGTRLLACRHLETAGIFLNTGLECRLQSPAAVMPGQKFSVTVQVTRPAKVFLISRAVDAAGYFSLGRYFLHLAKTMLAALGDDHLPPLPCWKTADWQAMMVANDLLEIKELTVADSAIVELVARPSRGGQQLVCLAGDDFFFAEAMVTLQVAPPSYVTGYLPPALGPGDCAETQLTFTSRDPEQLQIESDKRGLLHDRQVQGSGSVPLTIQTPETITVRVGNWENRQEIGSLGRKLSCHATLNCLRPGEKGGERRQMVYATGGVLADEIVQSLLLDRHQDAQTLAARLGGAARLYQYWVAKKQDDRRVFWQENLERIIAESQERLLSLASAQGRFGYASPTRPDPKITLEIVHHLAPFLQIPRFEELHQLAKRTLEAALEWKLKSNRLFGLNIAFQERKIKSPESAAAALFYNLEPEKARTYLKKIAIGSGNTLAWQGEALGGMEASTAIVLRALQFQKDPLFADALAFFYDKLVDGCLANPAATLALVEVLLEMESWPGKILPDSGGVIVLDGKTEIAHPFTVERGMVWLREERTVDSYLLTPTPPAPLRISWQGPKTLRPGGKFSLALEIRGMAYPTLEIVVAHQAVLLNTKTGQGHVVWPEPGCKHVLHGQACCQGMGHFYFIVSDRYNRHQRFIAPYPLVVA